MRHPHPPIKFSLEAPHRGGTPHFRQMGPTLPPYIRFCAFDGVGLFFLGWEKIFACNPLLAPLCSNAMHSGPKDDPLVVQFLVAFSRFRNACDDDPTGIIRQSYDDESFGEICLALQSAYYSIKNLELNTSEKSIRFTGNNFIKARRLFEKRFAMDVAIASYYHSKRCDLIIDETFSSVPHNTAIQNSTEALKREKEYNEVDWELADEEAKKTRECISDAMRFASDMLFYEGDPPDEYDYENIQEGLDKLTLLTNEGFGPDLKGLYRRRDLTPLTLIPTRISHGDGDQITISAVTLLEDAQRAFIFGTPLAALALLRAVLEIVLTDNLKIEGKDLADKINKAGKFLPSGLYPIDLHRLRMDANSLLHDRGSRQREGGITGQMDLELSISNHFHKMRLLMESFSR